MARLGEIRKGLKDAIQVHCTGLKAYATMPASPQTPAAAVIPKSRRLVTMDGTYVYGFSVWVYVNPSDLNRAQTQIDEYLSVDGPNSIEAAIDADPSLGGVADSAVITGWSDYASLVDVAGGQMLAARLDAEVYISS